jgi:hypothetical protein
MRKVTRPQEKPVETAIQANAPGPGSIGKSVSNVLGRA